MVNDDIVKYISSNLKRGLTYEEIHTQLLAHNYSDYDIKEAKDRVFSQVKSLPNKEITYSSYPIRGIKYFLVVFLIILIMIVGIILGKYFLEKNQNQITIYEENLSKINKIELEKNNILNLYFEEKINHFSIESKREMISVSGKSDFSLLISDSKSVDLNEDNEFDVVFSYLGNNLISIEKICHEKWACSEWDSCLNGKRIRDCTEENKCGTEKEKPSFEEIC